MDLSGWLRSLGLEQYEQAFRDNAIEWELTAEDLKDLGVTPVGHRRKLLDAIASLRPAGAEPPTEAERGRTSADAIGERRQVTVLFADLAGYTELDRQIDAEEVHALLGHFFDRADRIVQDHGGRIF